MINVLASIKVKSGKKSEFLKIFKANVPLVKKEKGCIEYCPTVDFDTKLSAQKLDGDIVTIIENINNLSNVNSVQINSSQYPKGIFFIEVSS